MPQQVQALVRSQAGAGAGAALTAAPTIRETTILPHLFRVILLRRLRQALSLSVRNCRCGRPLDFCGHHRAACARVGVLGRCGGRVRTNMLVRDMDLDVPIADARRLEVVVDGLPLQERAQLAVDTTLVCALHADGRPRLGAAKHDGVALKVAGAKIHCLPRIGWSPQPSQAGGSGSRRGWSTVGGDQSFPEPVGKCTCEVSCHSRDVERSQLGV